MLQPSTSLLKPSLACCIVTYSIAFKSCQNMIKAITDLKQLLPMGIFYDTNILDLLKGSEDIAWIKIRLTQKMRPADGEQKAGAKNTDLMCGNIQAAIRRIIIIQVRVNLIRDKEGVAKGIFDGFRSK